MVFPNFPNKQPQKHQGRHKIDKRPCQKPDERTESGFQSGFGIGFVENHFPGQSAQKRTNQNPERKKQADNQTHGRADGPSFAAAKTFGALGGNDIIHNEQKDGHHQSNPQKPPIHFDAGDKMKHQQSQPTDWQAGQNGQKTADNPDEAEEYSEEEEDFHDRFLVC